jgi:hypothetical protein
VEGHVVVEAEVHEQPPSAQPNPQGLAQRELGEEERFVDVDLLAGVRPAVGCQQCLRVIEPGAA